MGGCKLEAPFVFPGDISARTAAIVKLHVIDDLAIVDECPGKLPVILPAIVLTALNVGRVRNQRENGERVLQFRRERDGRSRSGLRCGRQCRHAIPDVVGEVRRRIIRVREPDSGAVAANRRDTIAHEPAIRLHRSRNRDRPNIVASDVVPVALPIVHRKVLPARRVIRIAAPHIRARLHELHMKRGRLHTFAIRHSHRHHDRLAGLRTLRFVLDPCASRRRTCGGHAVHGTRSRTPAAAFHKARKCQRGIHGKVAAIERGIEGLHREHILAGRQKSRDILNANLLPITCLVLLRDRFQRERALRDMQARDLVSVHPNHTSIVHPQRERKRRRHLRHGEPVAKKRARIAALHIRNDRRVIVITIPEPSLPARPRTVLFELASGPRSRLGVSAHPFPSRASGRNEDARRRSLRIRKSRCPPVARPCRIGERMNPLQG